MSVVALVPGGVAALVVSLLVAAAVSTATVHVAARYVLGDVSLRQAALVGPVAPVVVLVASSLPALVVLGVSLVADLAAVHLVYRVGYGTAGLVAVVHYAVSLLLGVAVANVVRLLAGTA